MFTQLFKGILLLFLYWGTALLLGLFFADTWSTFAVATGGSKGRAFVLGTSVEVSVSKVFCNVKVVCFVNFGQNLLVITAHLLSFCTSFVDDPPHFHSLGYGHPPNSALNFECGSNVTSTQCRLNVGANFCKFCSSSICHVMCMGEIQLSSFLASSHVSSFTSSYCHCSLCCWFYFYGNYHGWSVSLSIHPQTSI